MIRQATNIFARYRESKLLKSGIWYLIATVGQRGLAFVGVFIFTRLMSVDEYGTVSVFLSWVAIFASTITLNVYGAISPAKYDYDDAGFRRFVSASTVLGSLTCLIAILVLWITPDAWLSSLFDLPKLYLILAAIVTLAELSVSASSAMWQIEYRYRTYALVSTLLAVFKLALPVLLIVLPFTFSGDNALARVIGTAIASVTVGGLLFRYILVNGKTWYQRDYWRYAVAYGVPLIPHALSGFILSHFDRILTDRFVGRAAAGLYTFAYQIGEMISILWIASNNAWVPWFFEQMGRKNYAGIRQRATQYMLAFAGLSALVIIAGPIVMALFAPPEYQPARKIVPIIMCSQFFNLAYALYANVEFFEKKTGYISVGTGLAALVNVLLNVWWLPIWGYPAAAWSTLISYILLWLFHASIVRFRLRSEVKFNFPLMVLLGIGMLAFSLVIYALA